MNGLDFTKNFCYVKNSEKLKRNRKVKDRQTMHLTKDLIPRTYFFKTQQDKEMGKRHKLIFTKG